MKWVFLLGTAFVLSACSSMPSWMPGGGWTTLIDGDKGMDNFTQVGDANWRVEDGAIVADKGKGGFLLSKTAYKDFELRVEFWAAHNANSGIYMRGRYELQIEYQEVDANDPFHSMGSIYSFVAPSSMLPRKPGSR